MTDEQKEHQTHLNLTDELAKLNLSDELAQFFQEKNNITDFENYINDIIMVSKSFFNEYYRRIESNDVPDPESALNDIQQLKEKMQENIKGNNMPQTLKKVFLDLFSTTTTDIKNKDKNKEGIIDNLDDFVALITDKNLSHALTPYPNPHAYIQQLDEEYFAQLEFNAEDGTIRTRDNSLEPITLKNVATRSNIKELDLPLLRSLYTIIYSYANKIDTNTVTIYLPTLAKHLGVNLRGDKPYELFSKIKAFDSVIGVLGNGSFYRMLTFLGYNKQTNSITFGSPYINQLLRALQKANTIRPKKKKKFTKPHHSFLIHGNIANERNKAAIEIVSVIVTLLMQRGEAQKEKEELTTAKIESAVAKGTKKAVQAEFSGNPIDLESFKEKTTITTVHKSFKAIIDEIPLLKESVGNAKTVSGKNTILKRVFSKAYSLLKEKTDIYKYYLNLNIPEIIPTSTTLNNVLKITHEGKDKKYSSV